MSKSTDEAPPPDITPSLLSKDTSVPISSLPVQLSVDDYTSKYPQNHLDAIVNNWRLSCYLAVAQIFLQKNALVDRKLEADDVKPRSVSLILLGVEESVS
jgi:xylulose-5-phosphate/fructose-6-phosphate phosphoketolase